MERTPDILALAEAHVREGERRVEEQRARIEALRRHGHETNEAEKLLATFEGILSNMREHLAQEQGNADADRQR